MLTVFRKQSGTYNSITFAITPSIHLSHRRGFACGLLITSNATGMPRPLLMPIYSSTARMAQVQAVVVNIVVQVRFACEQLAVGLHR